MGAETQTWPEQSRWKSNLLGRHRRVDGVELVSGFVCVCVCVRLASQLAPMLTATKMNSGVAFVTLVPQVTLMLSLNVTYCRVCLGLGCLFVFSFDAERSKVSESVGSTGTSLTWQLPLALLWLLSVLLWSPGRRHSPGSPDVPWPQLDLSWPPPADPTGREWPRSCSPPRSRFPPTRPAAAAAAPPSSSSSSTTPPSTTTTTSALPTRAAATGRACSPPSGRGQWAGEFIYIKRNYCARWHQITNNIRIAPIH